MSNSAQGPKCACRKRASKDLRPCIECKYKGNFCPDCPHCPACGWESPGCWFCHSCQKGITLETMYTCVDCETHHCAECVLVCNCEEEEDGERHYVCDNKRHKCRDKQCDNYVCSNAEIYYRVCICNEHELRPSKRIMKGITEYARKHKRVREELTEQLWTRSKKSSM